MSSNLATPTNRTRPLTELFLTLMMNRLGHFSESELYGDLTMEVNPSKPDNTSVFTWVS